MRTVACSLSLALTVGLAVGQTTTGAERALDAAPSAVRPTVEFLLRHMPAADVAALSPEFVLHEAELAHSTRTLVPWGSELSDDLFLNYVVPYAQANEKREGWRTDFTRRFLPRVLECNTPGEAARRLNETIFDELNVHYSTERRRADQAPSESIEQGKASCTGLSILLADACRACCVPARLVSVRWPHKRGNHTWVEIWDGKQWRFCGADEPDPKGLDRAWFTGDANKCVDADREHRIWAISYKDTGERFRAGWERGDELWGTDVTERYAPQAADSGSGNLRGSIPTSRPFELGGEDPAAAALAAQLDRFFAADAAVQQRFEFDRNLDEELRMSSGDARLRILVFEALRRHEQKALSEDHDQSVVKAGDKQSPFTVKQVGDKPAGGWPLVIAMHGGGGAPKRVNDSQWRHMQIYYKDHPEVGGYLYCALRAPTDEWNGFYTDYFYPVIERLIRQFVVCADVDPDRVIALGYSHGGYGAFAVGPKLPHRFAAVHSSAAAPTDGQSLPTGLHSLRFSFMVGGKDTAYGRRERCEGFAAALEQLQRAHPDHYPTQFTLVEGNGHGGLPDRDLLTELVPHVRTAAPKQLSWQPSDRVVKDHYWLHVAEPQAGQRLAAHIFGQQLLYSTVGTEDAEAWLDARLCDLGKPVTVRDLGEGWAFSDPMVAEELADPRTLTPAPSLRTLCATMLERGDPALAATWIIDLP